MPVKAVKRGNSYRVIEANTGRIAKTQQGNARDGGGHSSQTKAAAQARAINASKHKK